MADGEVSAAIRKLMNLRDRVDGCGAAPDANDWIAPAPSKFTSGS